MVYQVCSNVVYQQQLADDVFQATFLKLVTAARGGRVAWQPNIGGWLRKVAFRTSLCAKRKAGREAPGGDLAQLHSLSQGNGDERSSMVKSELAQLPVKYRIPIERVYLSERTREEVAGELGIRPSSVRALLTRGFQMLRRRLARRGLAVGTVAVGATQTGSAASAAVPPSLVHATVKAAGAALSGEASLAGAVSANVLALATTPAVGIAKFTIAASVLCALVLVGAGLGVGLAYRTTPPTEPAALQSGSDQNTYSGPYPFVRRPPRRTPPRRTELRSSGALMMKSCRGYWRISRASSPEGKHGWRAPWSVTSKYR